MGKSLLTAVIAAAVAAVLVAALPATSAPNASVPKRLARLESQVRVLKARLAYDESCAANVLGVSQYSGYLYTPDHGTTVQETTAIDAAGSGQTPGAMVQLVSPSCVRSAAKAAAGASLRRAFPAAHLSRSELKRKYGLSR